MALTRDHQPDKKNLSASDALQKIYRYCAYQERSHQEVKTKLYSFGLTTDEGDEIISRLITEGFLNEERFAKAFSGGKFRMQKWGRNKIIHQLESKGLTQNCIRRGLLERLCGSSVSIIALFFFARVVRIGRGQHPA